MKHSFDDIPTSELSRLIDEWIHNSTYREILKSRFLEGMTFEELAQKYDYSVRHTKHIVYKYGDYILLKIK